MRILVVDGNSIVNRAFYGIRPLTNKDGQFTHAIYGFLNMLNKIERDENPDAVAIAFDLKAPTFRHKAYDGYKANRKGMPPELASQMPVLKELLTLLGYKLVTCEGFEADDILGTFADACEHNSDECVIATGDRDSLQLVSDETVVHLCTNKGDLRYTPEKIMEEYGVTPSGLIEIKAIQGDSSDNIPGVAGIGPKGAGDLIKRFKTVEEVYENIDSPEIKDGVRKKLIASKDNAILSRMLGEIVRNVPIDTDVSRYKVVCEDVCEGQISCERSVENILECDLAVFFCKRIISFLFHKNACGVACDPVGELNSSDALSGEHKPPCFRTGCVNVGFVVALGHIGQNLARGDPADGNADGFSAYGHAAAVKVLGDNVHPVVGRIRAEFGGGCNFDIDRAVSFHGEREGFDICERSRRRIVLVNIELLPYLVGLYLVVESLQLFYSLVIGINLLAA